MGQNYTYTHDAVKQLGDKLKDKVQEALDLQAAETGEGATAGAEGAADAGAAASRETRANPKNLKLLQQEEELGNLLDKYQNELEAWNHIEKLRVDQQAQDQAREQTQTQARDEQAASEAGAAAGTTEEEQGENEGEGEGEDKEDDELLGRVDSAIKQLQVINAKLRAVKNLVHAGQQTSVKLAQSYDKRAFAAYQNKDHPAKIIKAMTQD